MLKYLLNSATGLAVVGVVTLCCQRHVTAEDVDDRPNILLIMVDDLGWMDLACQGNQLVETPNIDRLANQGMRFTDAYAAAPVCSPTRAAVLTGLAPARLRITNHIPDQKRFIPDNPKLLPAPMLDHLPLEHVTIAERLKSAGYDTAFLGKWHLSGNGSTRDGGKGRIEFAPENQGFDVNIGGAAYGGPPSFFSPYRIYSLPDGADGEYLPYRLAEESISLIERKREHPFFICLWNYTVHWPMQAPEDLLKKYESRTGRGLNDTRYGAMIEALDVSIGRILKSLDDSGQADNTLVIFASDNGGFGGVSDCRPLREAKGSLYEGGIRVPLIIRWPGHVRPGTVNSTPVISMDFFPTLLELAGLESDPSQPLDGESLVPVLKETGTLKRDALYFHYPNYAWHRSNRLGGAIREGNLKLVENFDDGSGELYDLANDLSEKHDLASERPADAARLRKRLADWRHETKAAMPLPVAQNDQ
jgi:arylsulfatase A-like enzyme